MATKPVQSPDGDVAVAETVPKLKEPTQYAVVLHNDDYTPMEFVIDLLAKFFSKNQAEAEFIMLQVHHKGSGVAGIYTHDIAETKMVQSNDYAKKHGHPLKTTMEAV